LNGKAITVNKALKIHTIALPRRLNTCPKSGTKNGAKIANAKPPRISPAIC
jgi:hypothetical protein